MKSTTLAITVLTVASSLFAATDTARKTPAQSPKPVAAKPMTIPKSAMKNADGTYTYKDNKGKVWRYRYTPFGLSRTEAVPEATASTASALTGVKATVSGDKTVFERQTPFGISRIEKNTADLTDEERRLVDDQKAKQE